MKTVVIFLLLGIILGAAAASLIVPPALSWYNEAGYVDKGSKVPSLVVVPDVVRYSTHKLIRGQMIGGAIGGVLFLILGIALASRGRNRVSKPGAPPEISRK